MITAIEIENFKAFGIRQRIELKPITLLFGPNGAGKSAVADAMRFASRVITSVGHGDRVTGGTFRNVAHGHDGTVSIKLAFEFDFGAVIYGEFPQNPGVDVVGDGRFDEMLDIIGRGDSACVELTIDLVNEKPRVSQTMISVDGHRLAMVSSPTRNGRALAQVNFGHPIFEIGMEFEKDPEWRPDDETWESAFWERRKQLFGESGPVQLNLTDGLPTQSVEVAEAQREKLHRDLPDNAVENFNAVVRYVLAQPILRLRFELQQSRFLDARRGEYDNADSWRGFDLSRCCELLRDSDDVRAQVSSRLLARQGLLPPLAAEVRERWQTTGRRRTTSKLPDWNAFDPGLIAELRSKRIVFVDERTQTELEPDQLSLGTATLLPIVAACVDTRNNAEGKYDRDTALPVGMVLIEEPEAHLHPTAAAALGDLFVDTALRKTAVRKQILLETHSEHMTLRILRRVREESRESNPEFSENEIAIYYFSGGGHFGQPIRLQINSHGEFLQPWPDDFFNQDDLERFS